MKYKLIVRGIEIEEIEADSLKQAEDKAHELIWNETHVTPAVELSFPKMMECLHLAMTQIITSGGEILEGISVDDVVKMKEFVRAAEQNPQIGKTIVTEPNASSFYRWLEHECHGLILDSIDKDGVQPIVIQMYGRKVEIDTGADNFEALCTFLKEVIANEDEEASPE